MKTLNEFKKSIKNLKSQYPILVNEILLLIKAFELSCSNTSFTIEHLTNFYIKKAIKELKK